MTVETDEALAWHYGPTETDSEPAKMWHYDCGGEVMIIDAFLVCECGASQEVGE